MIRRIAFAGLSAAVVLGGAAVPAAANMILGGYLGAPAADQTPAAGQKSGARKVKAAAPTSRHARNAKASAAPVAQEDIDPRAAYLQKRKGSNSHETSCDTNPQCNGWAQWLSDVESGKRPMVGAHAQQ